MKIIDSHVHLYPEPDLEKELHISQKLVERYLNRLSQKITKEKIDEAMIYVLDRNFLSMKISAPKNLIISSTIGTKKNYASDLEKAFNKGIKIIKILPYEQKIIRERYPQIIKMAKLAKKKKMALSICSTYGSKLLYDTNGVELAAHVKSKVDIPIILAHAGGPKIFEAMTLALEYENIFLDLSFSLKYWRGSSVIKDFAFALKKLNYKKCFYGSDYPYVDFNESLEYFLRFAKEYNFSKKGRYDMLYANFKKFKRKYL